MDPAAIHSRLRRTYPQPPPSLEWVQLCISALVEDGQQPTYQAVEEQYLWSDLSTSTTGPSIPSTSPLPPTLFLNPTLLQVHSISEVGASAFSQQSTLEARRDVISGATIIRRMDEDETVEEGKVPPYPRSMLALNVSDGRSMIRAMEYRHLPGLTLGETKLGTKIRVHNVRCLKGVLLLEPKNTTVVGGAVEDMDAEQAEQFVQHLQDRLAAAKEHKPSTGKRKTTVTKTAVARKRQVTTRPPPATTSLASARASVSTSASTSASAREARLAAIQAALNPADPPTRPPRVSLGADTTFADDSFDIDDDFIQHINAVEAAAATATRLPRSQGRSSQRSQPPPGVEIIEISD